MKELHNLQGVVTQLPRVQRLLEHQAQLLPNGTQVLNVIKEKERKEAMTQVQEFEATFPTEREEPEKRKAKKDSQRNLNKNKKKGGVDIYG